MTIFDQLKSQRDNRDTLVQELESTGAVVTGSKVKCFMHEDRHPSASIFQGDDGTWRYWCHVCNWGGDLIDIHNKRNGTIMKITATKHTSSTAAAAACKPMTLDEIRQWLHKKVGPIESEHPYRSIDGIEIMRMFRCKIPGDKDYRPARREGDGWILKQVAKPWLLYQLDKINGADVVVVVEGEKCCDALAELSIPSTTNPHGAKKAHHANWAPLAGKKVILWPDADGPGLEHMQDVGNILSHLNPAPQIKLIDPGGLGLAHKEDVADFINRVNNEGGDAKPEVLSY